MYIRKLFPIFSVTLQLGRRAPAFPEVTDSATFSGKTKTNGAATYMKCCFLTEFFSPVNRF